MGLKVKEGMKTSSLYRLESFQTFTFRGWVDGPEGQGRYENLVPL
jgi:hypothetical protein